MAVPSREGAEPLQAGDVLSFEHALERLEGVVERLEGGELALEDALAAFEEGVQLSRRCAEQLAAAERRIEVLVQDEDGVEVRPFDACGEDE